MKEEKNESRLLEGLLWFLRFTIVLSMGYSFINGEWESFFISLLALGLTGLPLLIEKKYRVTLPIEFDLILVGFIYFAVFIGEVGDAYENFWWWDSVLHISSGIVLAFAGFLPLYILYVKKKFQAGPFMLASLAFATAMAAGGVWEIFEFTMDGLFGLNMQKNGLDDTMYDLIVDAVGALVVSILVYRFLKSGERSFVTDYLKKFEEENPKLFRRKK